MTAKRKTERIPLQKTIWCKIRYWQNLHDVSDEELAGYLGCSKRTLLNYDHDPSCVTLKAVDTFLFAVEMTLTDFMTAA